MALPTRFGFKHNIFKHKVLNVELSGYNNRHRSNQR